VPLDSPLNRSCCRQDGLCLCLLDLYILYGPHSVPELCSLPRAFDLFRQVDRGKVIEQESLALQFYFKEFSQRANMTVKKPMT
jgi:hypothetical protein